MGVISNMTGGASTGAAIGTAVGGPVGTVVGGVGGALFGLGAGLYDNWYNSPKHQKEQLEEAGINPNGNVSPVQSTMGQNVQAGTSLGMQAQQNALEAKTKQIGLASARADLLVKQNQAEYIDAQKNAVNQDIALKSQQQVLNEQQKVLNDLNIKYVPKAQQAELKKIKAQVAQYYSSVQKANAETDLAKKQSSLIKLKSDEQVLHNSILSVKSKAQSSPGYQKFWNYLSPIVESITGLSNPVGKTLDRIIPYQTTIIQ